MKPSGGQLQLTVGYLNINAERANAILDSIRVAADDGTGTRLLQVYSADQYITKLRRQEKFALAMKGAADGINNQNAGFSTKTTYNSSFRQSTLT